MDEAHPDGTLHTRLPRRRRGSAEPGASREERGLHPPARPPATRPRPRGPRATPSAQGREVAGGPEARLRPEPGGPQTSQRGRPRGRRWGSSQEGGASLAGRTAAEDRAPAPARRRRAARRTKPHGHLEAVNRPPAQAARRPPASAARPARRAHRPRSPWRTPSTGLTASAPSCGGPRQGARDPTVSTRTGPRDRERRYWPGSRRPQRGWGAGPPGAASRASPGLGLAEAGRVGGAPAAGGGVQGGGKRGRRQGLPGP